MKHIFLFLALAPALALAQTGTVKDSVRVLTTAEITALAPQDTSNVYFIHEGSWRKTRFDTIYQYARLKQLGDRGDIDVTGADGLTWTVDTNAVGAISIAAGAVDSTKLAAGAVVLPGAKVTGTLPVNKGGTGRSALTANKVMVATNTDTVLTPTNLHWDSDNSRLGIGTVSPSKKLDIVNSGNDGIVMGLTANNTNKEGTFMLRHYSTSEENIAGFTIATESGVNNVLFGGGSSLLNAATSIFFYTASNSTTTTGTGRMVINGAGNVGIGTPAPTARLHLPAGANATSSAPLKFTSGTLRTAASAEAGTMEYNSSAPFLYFTPTDGNRRVVALGLTGSNTLDFGNTSQQSSADLTITVTGAAEGDIVSLGVPNAAVNANTCYTAWVSAADTVTVRFNNYSSGSVDPASATFKVYVHKN